MQFEPIEIPHAGTFFPKTSRDTENAFRTRLLIESAAEDAFQNSTLPAHVTASGFLLTKERTAVLLTLHVKLGCWLPLGGHCDGITDARSVALRELHEESGLTSITAVSDAIFDIDIHIIPETPTFPAHEHYDIRYLFCADENEPLQISRESRDLRWVSLCDLDAYSEKHSVLVLLEKLDMP